MRRNRTVVIMALTCALVAVPARAYASDGFLGGLEDLTGTRQVEQGQKGYEKSFQEEYEPELREVSTEPVRSLPEDATTVDYVNSTVDAFNRSGYPSSVQGRGYTLVEGLPLFLGVRNSGVAGANRTQLILPAIGIVFMWWGVRKAKNMIMNGFRKGRITT